MTANINDFTGIAYGYIAADDLDPELVHELMFGPQAKDLDYEDAYAEALAEHKGDPDDLDFYYENDEPCIRGSRDGVEYQTSWLGGALNFWIFHSPFLTNSAGRASPCVPNAGILPAREDGTVLSYNVPADWLYDYEEETA